MTDLQDGYYKVKRSHGFTYVTLVNDGCVMGTPALQSIGSDATMEFIGPDPSPKVEDGWYIYQSQSTNYMHAFRVFNGRVVYTNGEVSKNTEANEWTDGSAYYRIGDLTEHDLEQIHEYPDNSNPV